MARTHDAGDTNKTVRPILGDTVEKRLDGIVRRQHGTPRPAPGKVTQHLPTPPRGPVKGQRKLW